MEETPRRALAHEAEAVVRRVRGVSAVRVDLGDDGAIAQVHVLGSAERTPRVIVADVIAALGAELGLSVAPGQVRAATLRPGQPSAGPAPVRSRLKFVGLTVSRLRSSADVRVQVEHEGLVYEGASSGRSGAPHLLELTGQATLRAVETYLRADAFFTLQAAAVVPVATHQVALVLVAWLGPEEELLTGSAVVREDPRDAVVRAVLDAVNRPVGWLGTR